MDHFEFDAQTTVIPRRDFIKLSAGVGVMMAIDPLGTSAQSTAGRPISIDLYTHWVPEAYDKALAQLKRPAPASTNPLDFESGHRVPEFARRAVESPGPRPRPHPEG